MAVSVSSESPPFLVTDKGSTRDTVASTCTSVCGQQAIAIGMGLGRHVKVERILPEIAWFSQNLDLLRGI